MLLKKWKDGSQGHLKVIAAALVNALAIACIVTLIFGVVMWAVAPEKADTSSTATTCTIDRSGVESSTDGNMTVKKGTRVDCDGVAGSGTVYRLSK